MGRIEWLPISELPEDFDDDRDMLLWHNGSPVVGFWTGVRWTSLNGEMGDILHPTHFAEINPPGEQDPGIPMFGMRTEK